MPRSVIAGVVAAIALALAWTRGAWPAVPGAAWALMFSMLAIALTERVQRTMEAHLAGLAPWLATLPTLRRLALAGARAGLRADDGGRCGGSGAGPSRRGRGVGRRCWRSG